MPGYGCAQCREPRRPTSPFTPRFASLPGSHLKMSWPYLPAEPASRRSQTASTTPRIRHRGCVPSLHWSGVGWFAHSHSVAGFRAPIEPSRSAHSRIAVLRCPKLSCFPRWACCRQTIPPGVPGDRCTQAGLARSRASGCRSSTEIALLSSGSPVPVQSYRVQGSPFSLKAI